MDMADNPFNIGYGEEEELDRPRLSMSRALNLDSDSGSGMFDAAGFIGDRNFQNPNDRSFMSYLFEGLADAGMVGDSFRRARQGKVDRIEFRNKQLKDAINMLPEDDQKIMALSEAGFFGKDPKTSESARQLALKMRNKRLLEEAYKKEDRENLEELRRREAIKFDQSQEDRETKLARNKEEYERRVAREDLDQAIKEENRAFTKSIRREKLIDSALDLGKLYNKTSIDNVLKSLGYSSLTEEEDANLKDQRSTKRFNQVLKNLPKVRFSNSEERNRYIYNQPDLTPEQKRDLNLRLSKLEQQKVIDDSTKSFSQAMRRFGIFDVKDARRLFSRKSDLVNDEDMVLLSKSLNSPNVSNFITRSSDYSRRFKNLLTNLLDNRDNIIDRRKNSKLSKTEVNRLTEDKNAIDSILKGVGADLKKLDFFRGRLQMPDEEDFTGTPTGTSTGTSEKEVVDKSDSKIVKSFVPYTAGSLNPSEDIEKLGVEARQLESIERNERLKKAKQLRKSDIKFFKKVLPEEGKTTFSNPSFFRHLAYLIHVDSDDVSSAEYSKRVQNFMGDYISISDKERDNVKKLIQSDPKYRVIRDLLSTFNYGDEKSFRP